MEEDDYLAISALQHLLYCERQMALIHVEGVWAENASTVAGRVLHERVDTDEVTSKPGVTVLRHVSLRSDRLRLRGIADVVEVHDGGRIVPIEYKRTGKKAPLADAVQVAAQAMALEEMIGTSIAEGFVFHGKTRRRSRVVVDHLLRSRVSEAARRLHELVSGLHVPAAVFDKRCEDCSLEPRCMPQRNQGLDPNVLLLALRGLP